MISTHTLHTELQEACKSHRVYQLFTELSSIPRKSGHEQGVIQWLQQFAQKHNLQCTQEKGGNILITKPAQKSNATDTVLLQAHMDMVCQKTTHSDHDFLTDPISILFDGDYLKAHDTTLGADNGIGLCMICALLEDTQCAHPPLIALFTVDEEVGMSGVLSLDSSEIENPSFCINLDSEEEGMVYISSAGSLDLTIAHTFERAIQQAPHVYVLTLTGLRGGHSGVDIEKNRLNANKVISTFLIQHDIALIDMSIGNARNAIPRDGKVVFACHMSYEQLLPHITKMQRFLTEYEEKAIISVEEISDTFEYALSPQDSRALLSSMVAITSGVINMNTHIPTLVETSNNLGVVTLNEGHCSITMMIRSSDTHLLQWYARSCMIQALSALGVYSFPVLAYKPYSTIHTVSENTTLQEGACISGWAPQADNTLLHTFQEVHHALYNRYAKELAIHAGLECGILSQYYPHMNIISFGPTILDAHTPTERVEIGSMLRTYDLFTGVLFALSKGN